jgi:hypothetical protein
MRTSWPVVVALGLAACGGRPGTPSQTVELTSLRYVRSYPVVAQAPNPTMHLSVKFAGDPFERSTDYVVSLTLDGEGAYSSPPAPTYPVPVDTTFGVSVIDEGVAQGGPYHQVASTIYVNGVPLVPTIFPMAWKSHMGQSTATDNCTRTKGSGDA